VAAPFLSADEFGKLLLEHPIETVVREQVFKGTPFVFREQPEILDVLREHLRGSFKLQKDNVIVVGSAKLGFSLNPYNFPRQFSEDSDIDVLVVDHELFDEVWMTLLKWQYPRRGVNLGGEEGKWARVRRKELYWGWFVPSAIRFRGLSFTDTLRPIRDISTEWFNCFQSLSQYPEFVSRKVSGRLYRTWDHALLYQADGLRQIRDVVMKESSSRGL
jgi:hypothetical protein